MSYNGYDKISHSSTEWESLPKKRDVKWICTEKIHGSYFCFIYDVKTKEVIYTKKTSFDRE